MNKKKDKGNGQMGTRSMTERKVDPFCMWAYENGYHDPFTSNSSCQINLLSLPQFLDA